MAPAAPIVPAPAPGGGSSGLPIAAIGGIVAATLLVLLALLIGAVMRRHSHQVEDGEPNVRPPSPSSHTELNALQRRVIEKGRTLN